MILCDTDVLIEYLKGNKNTRDILSDILASTDIALSAVTLMELYFGALNKRELNKIKKALSNFAVLPLDEDVTDISVNLIESYSKSYGLRIPDALIAATAIQYDLELWTYNIKDFRFINRLILYR